MGKRKPPSQRPERQPNPAGKELGDIICSTLHKFYVEHQPPYLNGAGSLEFRAADLVYDALEKAGYLADGLSRDDVSCVTEEVLHMTYVEARATFQAMAKDKGVPLESIAAAALASGLQKHGFVTLVASSKPEGNGLSIPPIPTDLELPIKCLVHAASTLDRLLTQAAETGDAFGLIKKHLGLVTQSVQVIGVWRDHLKMDLEALLDELNED